jgi:DNA-directed RNA polymerase sigma subunit (sigma70/sigma32)
MKTQTEKKPVDAPLIEVGFVQEHRMTRAELYELRDIVIDYMTEHDVSIESAVMDLIELDRRFGGGFECREIAIIMGTSKDEIKRVEARALKKLKHPDFGGKDIQAYFRIENSEAISEF